jgi:hypothetical protein
MSYPHILSEIISEDVSLNLVEPDIYSVYSTGASPGSYDSIGASPPYVKIPLLHRLRVGFWISHAAPWRLRQKFMQIFRIGL